MEENINIETLDFKSIIDKNLIKIPRIQRDYAQGRDDEKAKSVRENFVKSLSETVLNAGKPLTLDFIYGYRIDNDNRPEFIPLDGQQRLTTLFLLHWLLGTKVGQKENSLYTAMLTYATRTSSSEFCNRLTSADASSLLTEINLNRSKNKNKKSGNNTVLNNSEREPETAYRTLSELDQLDLESLEKLIFPDKQNQNNIENHKKFEKLSQVITNNNKLFKWSWKFDPTVKGMLNMLDALVGALELDTIDSGEQDTPEKRLDYLQNKVRETQKQLADNLSNISFRFLNLGELHKDNKKASSDLYIKMNARGKELSNFDLLKSAIEQDIVEQQICYPNNNLLQTQKEWQECIDGKWLALLWNSFAKKDGNVNLESAKVAEEKLRIMLLRLIARQLVLDIPSAYNVDKGDFESRDGIPNLWKDYICQNKIKINYVDLIKDFNSLLYTYGSVCKPITELLEESVRWNPLSVKDEYYNFLDDQLQKDKMLAFHLMVKWCRVYPYSDASTEDKKKAWVRNFNRWTRLVRNVVMNDNNNDRIDSYKSYSDKLIEYSKWFDKGGFATDIDVQDPDGLTKHLASLKSDTTYSYLKEEISKADLSLDNQHWEECILRAESNKYLWGQIECLLDWAQDDYSQFSNYFYYWDKLVNNKEEMGAYDIQVAALANSLRRQNYQTASMDDIKIGIFNNDRDFSVKRLLRDKDNGIKYGVNEIKGLRFKQFIDDWISDAPDFTSKEWCKKVLEDCKNNPNAPTWLKFLCIMPSVAGDTDTQRICVNPQSATPGFLRRKKRDDAGFYDIALLTLKHIATENEYSAYCTHDRENDSDNCNKITAQKENNQITVQLNPDTEDYTFIKNETIIVSNLDSSDLIDTFKKHL